MGLLGTSKDETTEHLNGYTDQPRFEYALVTRAAPKGMNEETLNEYGAAGWELVGFNISDKHATQNYIFKRPI
jgi:hypothetical protein